MLRWVKEELRAFASERRISASSVTSHSGSSFRGTAFNKSYRQSSEPHHLISDGVSTRSRLSCVCM